MKKRTSPLATLFFLFAIAAVAVLFVAFAASLAGCGVEEPALTSTSSSGAQTSACAHAPRYGDVTAFRTSCERCHASTLPASKREGAPLDVNFDSYDAAVAAGHASYSEVETGGMPPDEALSTADRLTIIDWIRCGMAR
jgi:cytochrome c5